MAQGKFISYLRVSTQRQGRSGLGLEAQRKAVADFLNGGSWELLGEYIEVESGKKNDRPKLAKALAACKATGAQLVVAKLDRLARNVAFISQLMESGVEFTAADFPQANRLTVHVLAAVAEHEASMISQRTRAALAAAKARGAKLGTNNLTDEGRAKGHCNAEAARIAKADEAAASRLPFVLEYQEQGLSLNGIAKALNARGIRPPSGRGNWSPTSVSRMLKRASET